MTNTTDLGMRMKNFYEDRSKSYLLRRIPVAIRIDGKSFHTFTRDFQKPFDPILIATMQQTTKKLCENIQGCVLGYTQSDEITLILCDYQTLRTDAWFDYSVQKMASVSASMATLYFNRILSDEIQKWWMTITTEQAANAYPQFSMYKEARDIGAIFDSRCFNIPREEVTNLIYWRQLDAMRNSVAMFGYTYFPAKMLHGKSCNEIKRLLLNQYRINWDDIDTCRKWGTCIVKAESGWTIDKNIPIFKGDDRKYVEDKIIFDF